LLDFFPILWLERTMTIKMAISIWINAIIDKILLKGRVVEVLPVFLVDVSEAEGVL
jgi:hypothetical protein